MDSWTRRAQLCAVLIASVFALASCDDGGDEPAESDAAEVFESRCMGVRYDGARGCFTEEVVPVACGPVEGAAAGGCLLDPQQGQIVATASLAETIPQPFGLCNAYPATGHGTCTGSEDALCADGEYAIYGQVIDVPDMCLESSAQHIACAKTPPTGDIGCALSADESTVYRVRGMPRSLPAELTSCPTSLLMIAFTETPCQ